MRNVNVIVRRDPVSDVSQIYGKKISKHNSLNGSVLMVFGVLSQLMVQSTYFYSEIDEGCH
jgi:hypothetical protein